MTHQSTVWRMVTGLACLVLILGITVDILDELPSGSDPQPMAFDRAPITSPQLDGPLFQPSVVVVESNVLAPDQMTNTNPVADTRTAVQAAAVAAAANAQNGKDLN